MGNRTSNKKQDRTKPLANEATMDSSSNANNSLKPKEKEKEKKQGKEHKVPVEKYEIVFKWTEGGKSVCISGSFCKWKQMIALEKASDSDSFEIRLSLPVGVYQYKYLVDDKWLFSNEEPICTDENGNINNIIDINLIALKSKYSTDLKLFNFFELQSTANLPLEYLSHNAITFIYNNYIESTLPNYQRQRIPHLHNGSVHHFSLPDDSGGFKEVGVVRIGVCFRFRQKLSLLVYYKPAKDNRC